MCSVDVFCSSVRRNEKPDVHERVINDAHVVDSLTNTHAHTHTHTHRVTAALVIFPLSVPASCLSLSLSLSLSLPLPLWLSFVCLSVCLPPHTFLHPCTSAPLFTPQLTSRNSRSCRDKRLRAKTKHPPPAPRLLLSAAALFRLFSGCGGSRSRGRVDSGAKRSRIGVWWTAAGPGSVRGVRIGPLEDGGPKCIVVQDSGPKRMFQSGFRIRVVGTPASPALVRMRWAPPDGQPQSRPV